ncbi:MAG: alpha/beta hydrolase [Rhodospirillaceae bacterium]|mgnify:CR=1 FL=1|jgi:acetyl esterase|nr:alpha/beta hydrolase [Rhodospirillaceae bacterium]MBT4043378.1 alpha/beta hydrolase [Rhodospirillaceae bacterium]MBT4690380.1 alpha/beta hydrolase [Rhodospirillaceae bacterium]MBT5083997.1 alpha/beta hydrolase [Rhodospirillaceae bacterium]MBT5523907.1 alpha/beta hydrolase [Rhodospirillaceae bacterium]
MPLKPQLVEILEAMKALGMKPMHELSPVDAREQMEAGVRARNVTPIELGSIEEQSIPGPHGDIPVRIYRPKGASGPLGALVYYHGGGHVIGSMDTHDGVARAMCKDANIVVLSVDYRMGPEAKFPAAVDDCYAATKWLSDNADAMGVRADRIAVGGDSAGGNLALVVSLMARDTDDSLSVAYQLLVYPVMDYTGGTSSYESYGNGFGPLQAASIPYFVEHYLNDRNELADWRASPARAESFVGLPPALLITAECDILNDEGTACAARLNAEGVACEHVDYEGMMHGFFSMAPMLDDSVAAQALAASRLKTALS